MSTRVRVNDTLPSPPPSFDDDKASQETPTPPNGPLASPLATNVENTAGSALAYWVLQKLRIRPKNKDYANELDAVCLSSTSQIAQADVSDRNSARCIRYGAS